MERQIGEFTTGTSGHLSHVAETGEPLHITKGKNRQAYVTVIPTSTYWRQRQAEQVVEDLLALVDRDASPGTVRAFAEGLQHRPGISEARMQT